LIKLILDEAGNVWPCGLRPGLQAFRVAIGLSAVGVRHMSRVGGPSAHRVAACVMGHSLAIVKEFDHLMGDAGGHVLTGQAMAHGIPVLPHQDVVAAVHSNFRSQRLTLRRLQSFF
jgi:hypothetical protein